MYVLFLLLLAAALSAESQDSRVDVRKLQQDSAASSQEARLAIARMARPFLRVRDTETASRLEAQQLYDQAISISSIAYLIFAAAEPLSQAPGSSGALLTSLRPTNLRVYASRPGLCSSDLAQQLYGLSKSLYGTPALQSCHYALLKAVRATFTWIRDNIPLQQQVVPGIPERQQKSVVVAWPDLSSPSAHNQLTQAVLDALSKAAEADDGTDLAAAAAAVSGPCGLGISQFSAHVPNISRALQQLHADLAQLKIIARAVSPTTSSNSNRRRRAMAAIITADDDETDVFQDGDGGGHLASGEDRRALYNNDLAVSDNTLGSDAAVASSEIIVGDTALEPLVDSGDSSSRSGSRRALYSLPSRFDYSLPPGGFQVQPPSADPKLHLSIVFHVMQYRDGNAIGPLNYEQSPTYADRLVRVANYMAKPTGVSFFVKEVRFNASTHPYLLLRNRRNWLKIPGQDCMNLVNQDACFYDPAFVSGAVADFPRSINVFVASDASADKEGILGYAMSPPSDVWPGQGYMYVSWDQFSVGNSDVAYNDGPMTLLHEIFHFLGLAHTFDKPSSLSDPCFDGDYVADTPSVTDSLYGVKFYAKAVTYCLDLFWGRYGGDWAATYERWINTPLGIPELDKNAWADSCPRAPGYDELGNYMTYTRPPCIAALGHFTSEQVQRAKYRTSEFSPVMFAWGQYYAAQQAAAALSPQLSPPATSNAYACRVTALHGCACKSSWMNNGINSSYCDLFGNEPALWCEVQDPSTCFDCLVKNSSITSERRCFAPCAGTRQLCGKPPAPPAHTSPPPPPLPPSPPPRPPPPPPLSVPAECKVSATGCACRNTWAFQYNIGRYCTQFYNYTTNRYLPNLMCVVTPDCPTFRTSPFQQCALSFNVRYCIGGTSPPPSPARRPKAPKPPPPKPPRPSSPTSRPATNRPSPPPSRGG